MKSHMLTRVTDHSDLVKSNRWFWIRKYAGMAGFVAFVLLLVIGIPTIYRLYVKQDREGAISRKALGVVTAVTPGHVDRATIVRTNMVTVQWGKESEIINTVDGWKVGQEVRVMYRIGESGRIYLDDIEPLPAAPDAIAQRH
jgi:hypothetical protein